MDKYWTKALEYIKAQLSAGNYRTWFAYSKASVSSEGILVISVPSSFIKENLNTKYAKLIDEAISQIYPKPLQFVVQVNSTLTRKIHDTDKGGSNEKLDQEGDQSEDFFDISPVKTRASAAGLNPKYTLTNFVVGLSNNLAFAAAQAVVQNPGKSYNPLFVYGGTGVGKTHLMLGIGNSLLKANPSLKVIYCSSEKFTNDFIQSIQTKRTGEFRFRYRNCDLLLIDDIQFISGRDSTQEEFFHTFNELQTKNAQVVLTSDRPPGEIQKLESRLASRFQGGLMVDIQQPDFDTRVAILRAKCQEGGDQVPEEVLTIIAENMITNARELEGKLIQIVQTAKLTAQPLTKDSVLKFLGKPSSSSQKLEYKKVISEVNRYFNIKMVDLTGPRRKKELVLPRQVVMFLLYEECKMPYEKIGDLLGGRDHTTIIYGVEKIRESVTRDREIQRMVVEIKQTLQA